MFETEYYNHKLLILDYVCLRSADNRSEDFRILLFLLLSISCTASHPAATMAAVDDG